MAKPTEITIKIRNWEAYKGRKDVEHNSWFRCSNRLLEDPDFFDFSHEEILVWIYILSVSSQKNSQIVKIKLQHAEKVCRLKTSSVLSAIEKLKEDQIDPVDVTPTLRERDVDGTLTCATDRQTDITDKTDIYVQVGKADTCASGSPNELLELWNQECGALSKARELNDKRETAARSRLREKPDIEYWRMVIKKIAVSDWCNNRAPNSKGWEATFDWLLQPDTHLRVMEKKYDSRELQVIDPAKARDRMIAQKIAEAEAYEKSRAETGT